VRTEREVSTAQLRSFGDIRHRSTGIAGG
jgi:hypothetical protein